MKTCSKCKQEKPLDLFYRNGGTRNGRASQCKLCTDQNVKVYVAANRKRINALALKRYHANPEKQKLSRLKCVYGITSEEYFKLTEKQNEKCAICLKKVELCVDHNHKTGDVRGLLCHKCNAAIGLLDDSPSRLIAAASYLQKKS